MTEFKCRKVVIRLVPDDCLEELLLNTFEMRVKKNYILPREGVEDELISHEGLYVSVIVPASNVNKELAVFYEDEIIIQPVRNRLLNPKKSRTYHLQEKLMPGTSPTDLYPTLILPQNYLGNVVMITPCTEKLSTRLLAGEEPLKTRFLFIQQVKNGTNACEKKREEQLNKTS